MLNCNSSNLMSEFCGEKTNSPSTQLSAVSYVFNSTFHDLMSILPHPTWTTNRYKCYYRIV